MEEEEEAVEEERDAAHVVLSSSVLSGERFTSESTLQSGLEVEDVEGEDGALPGVFSFSVGSTGPEPLSLGFCVRRMGQRILALK